MTSHPYLRRVVRRDGRTFVPGDRPPADVAKTITNPRDWHDGVMPAGVAPADPPQVKKSEDSKPPTVELPTLKGKKTDELIAIAEAEGVDLADATNNKARVAAIEAHRSAESDS